jgi:ribose-phosphate pyrophosphokinase
LLGNVNGKRCIIVDDIADSFMTISEAASLLMDLGAKEILVMCIHAVLSEKSFDNILRSPINRLVFSNSLPIDTEKMQQLANSKNLKILILDISKIFAGAILNKPRK